MFDSFELFSSSYRELLQMSTVITVKFFRLSITDRIREYCSGSSPLSGFIRLYSLVWFCACDSAKHCLTVLSIEMFSREMMNPVIAFFVKNSRCRHQVTPSSALITYTLCTHLCKVNPLESTNTQIQIWAIITQELLVRELLFQLLFYSSESKIFNTYLNRKYFFPSQTWWEILIILFTLHISPRNSINTKLVSKATCIFIRDRDRY